MAPLIWIWILLCWGTGGSIHLHCCFARLLGLLGPVAENMEARGTEFPPHGKGSQAIQRGCLRGFPPSFSSHTGLCK